MMVLMTMVIYNDDDDEDGGDKVEWKKDSFPFHLLRPSTNSPNTDTSPTLKIQNILPKNIVENCRRETICQNFYLCWEGKWCKKHDLHAVSHFDWFGFASFRWIIELHCTLVDGIVFHQEI